MLFIVLFTTTFICISTTHAQGTFPEPLESASNSFVCTRETDMLWTVFNLSSGENDNSRSRRPQLIRFPADRACRSAAIACEQCLAQFATSAVRNCSNTGLSDDGELATVT